MNPVLFLSNQLWVERLGWTLVHFLWQGVLIASLYAIARKFCQRPQTRYLLACVTLTAMVALPLATFAFGSPSSLAPRGAVVRSVFPTSSPTGPISSSKPFESLPSTAPSLSNSEVMSWLVMAWFCGAIVLWARLVGGWIIATRMRSKYIRTAPAEWSETLDQLRARLRVSAPVRLLSSASVAVPTVVGWLRPVILLPVGALTGLQPEHVEILLAHELAHIRRRDYLVNILQSAAEALLFYHPAVWWVSRHIRAERESCCDDIAVAVRGDALDYVRALARLESCRPEHLTPSLAANGGSLPDRIARLLGQPRKPPHYLTGPGILTGCILLVVTACSLLGQAVETRPAFEVASVKRDKSATGIDRIQPSKGRLIIENVSLKRLIGMAYGVPDGRDYLFSGPDWLDSERFDIYATFPPDTSDAKMLLMLQRLLDERFKLKLHRETKEFTAYALVVDRGGPKLHKSIRQGGAYKFQAQGGHAVGSSLTMPQFADRLSRPVFQLDHQVVDFTGLNGTFDLTLDWRPETTQAEQISDNLDRPSIFSALKEQLGLALERRKVPLDVLVVDDAIRVPIEN